MMGNHQGFWLILFPEQTSHTSSGTRNESHNLRHQRKLLKEVGGKEREMLGSSGEEMLGVLRITNWAEEHGI